MKKQHKCNRTADSIVASADVALAETQLEDVTGGVVRKAGGLKIKLTQVFVTS